MVGLPGDGPYTIYTFEGHEVVGCSDDDEGEYCVNYFPEIEQPKKKKPRVEAEPVHTPPVVTKTPSVTSHGSTRPVPMKGMTPQGRLG